MNTNNKDIDKETPPEWVKDFAYDPTLSTSTPYNVCMSYMWKDKNETVHSWRTNIFRERVPLIIMTMFRIRVKILIAWYTLFPTPKPLNNE